MHQTQVDYIEQDERYPQPQNLHTGASLNSPASLKEIELEIV